jgi:hypothetical protein
VAEMIRLSTPVLRCETAGDVTTCYPGS